MTKQPSPCKITMNMNLFGGKPSRGASPAAGILASILSSQCCRPCCWDIYSEPLPVLSSEDCHPSWWDCCTCHYLFHHNSLAPSFRDCWPYSPRSHEQQTVSVKTSDGAIADCCWKSERIKGRWDEHNYRERIITFCYRGTSHWFTESNILKILIIVMREVKF